MRVTMRTTSRIAAYAVSATLAVSGSVLAVTPADAVVDPVPANQAADWLAGELDNGLMHNPNFGGFDDYGLTVDAGFALQAVGGHAPAVQSIKDALDDHVDDYVTPFGGPHSYTGGLAKLAAFVGHPADTSFGGQDLITELESRVATAAPIAGRIEDEGYTPGDQFEDDAANVLGQAYAANALSAAGSTAEAASVTSFLLKQQCSSGYFRLNFTKNKAAAGQSCVEGVDAPDTDATALAVLQLSPLTGQSAVAAAVDKAQSWLRAQQRCDGSFGGGTSTTASNGNSTGVVAWALGDSAASRQAAVWLRAHQASSADSGNSLASETGAIAYDDAALAAGRANGITDAVSDQWRRATAQAAPGVARSSTDATPAIDLTGPAGYLKAGSRQVLRTTGAGAGTVLCVTGPNASTRGIAAANGLSSTVVLPAGTATRTYVATDPYGHADAQALKVLGKKRLTVTKSQYRVKRGRYVTATVSGLAPAEWARVYYKGRPVRSGFASATGRFTATFKVGRAKGKKSIVGYGMFTDIRRGSSKIKVVR
jgi:hypothetical protein